MANEVIEFAKAIGAGSLRAKLTVTKHAYLFRMDNYFNLDGTFLIVKISRSQRPFWGLRKDIFEFFNMVTENARSYFFVALTCNKSGWFLSKQELVHQISDGSLSYSEANKQYIITPYNLRDVYSFTSPEDFLIKLEAEKSI